MVVPEEELKKQVAAAEETGTQWRPFFDPFNMLVQQLNRLDTRMDRLENKLDGLHQEIDTRLNELRREVKQDNQTLHQELHSTTRWIEGTIIAAAGLALALAQVLK